jgi:hypothetical protein
LPAFGLGLPGNPDISTTTEAANAYAQLEGVLASITNAYQTSNSPAGSASTASNTATGTTSASAGSSASAPAYLQAQLANYTLALNLLSSGSSGSSDGSSLVSLLA